MTRLRACIARALHQTVGDGVLGPLLDVVTGLIGTILAMTDGASAGVDDYGIPPTGPEAIQLAATDPAGLLALVHNTEATDPDATRWPRSKRHDDKALAVIHTRQASFPSTA